MVVLPSELEVVEQDCNLSACNDEDAEYKKKEGEDVVVLIRPDRSEDEI